MWGGAGIPGVCRGGAGIPDVLWSRGVYCVSVMISLVWNYHLIDIPTVITSSGAELRNTDSHQVFFSVA